MQSNSNGASGGPRFITKQAPRLGHDPAETDRRLAALEEQPDYQSPAMQDALGVAGRTMRGWRHTYGMPDWKWPRRVREWLRGWFPELPPVDTPSGDPVPVVSSVGTPKRTMKPECLHVRHVRELRLTREDLESWMRAQLEIPEGTPLMWGPDGSVEATWDPADPEWKPAPTPAPAPPPPPTPAAKPRGTKRAPRLPYSEAERVQVREFAKSVVADMQMKGDDAPHLAGIISAARDRVAEIPALATRNLGERGLEAVLRPALDSLADGGVLVRARRADPKSLKKLTYTLPGP